MATDTTVKFLHSAMTGAPSLSGTAGSLIALLDAALLNGFGSGTVDSVVISGGIGTVTRSSGHPFDVGSVAYLSGATVTGGSINGEQKVLTITSTTWTFDATGLSNQTATGTITQKTAPLGWTKVYSGTNLAAYKPSDITATGNLLRVDDTGSGAANYARVRGYETMSDINTGTGPFPTDAQVSGGLYWPKSNAADATTRSWILVGDGRIFYLMVAYSSNTSTSFGFNHVFGDIGSVKSPDPYACVINGFNSTYFGTNGNNSGLDYDYGDASNAATALYSPRSYVGLGSSVQLRKAYPMIAGPTSNKSGTVGMPYPNGADGGLYLAPHYIIDNVTLTYRGNSPGVYCVPQTIGNSVFSNRDAVSGVSGYSGKTFRMVNSNSGCFGFDITGPWR